MSKITSKYSNDICHTALCALASIYEGIAFGDSDALVMHNIKKNLARDCERILLESGMWKDSHMSLVKNGEK